MSCEIKLFDDSNKIVNPSRYVFDFYLDIINNCKSMTAMHIRLNSAINENGNVYLLSYDNQCGFTTFKSHNFIMPIPRELSLHNNKSISFDNNILVKNCPFWFGYSQQIDNELFHNCKLIGEILYRISLFGINRFFCVRLVKE